MSISTNVYNIEYEVRIHTRRNGLQTIFSNDVLRIDVETTKRSFNGAWKIVFVPREYDQDGATIYDTVEAMDYCEIAVKRNNPENALRVIIRGFVSKIFKSFTIKDGHPQRYITISGEDYGKIIRMAYIHYAAGLDPFQVIAAGGTNAPIALGYGIDIASQSATPAEVIQRLFDIFVIPNFQNIKSFIDDRAASTSPGTLNNTNNEHQDTFGDFSTDIDADGVNGVRNLQCNLQIIDRMAGAKEMPVETFMMEMAGLPWNELFIDNAPDQTFLVFRPFPYRDRNGTYIGATHFNGGSDDVVNSSRADTNTPIAIDQKDILSYQIQRSDEDVYNYFFTDSIYSVLGENFEAIVKSRAIETQKFNNPHYTVGETNLDPGSANPRTLPASDKLEYSRMELFGFRKAVFTTRFLSTTPSGEDIGKQYAEGSSSDPTMLFTGDQLNILLFNAFEHNSVLETAVYEIKGNETIRPGMFVTITDARHNSTPSVYYVTDVLHTIVPFETFTTRLILTRGEGHLDFINDGTNP